MADIIPLAKARKTQRKKKASGKTMCKSGFHKWTIDQSKQFDVRSGRLVTIRRCERCAETRTTLD
jgi:hypothetical protein